SSVYRGVEGAGKKSPLELPAKLGPKETLLKITYASLCGTDVHILASGMALGHEGVGVVEKIGSSVTQFMVGDRAGAGCIRKYIVAAIASIAPKGKMCIAMNAAPMTKKIITRAHSVPDNLPPDLATPLQCASATTYSAIVQSVKPGDRVGILGI
ncbi:putative formaldehyde dehydrogenase, partial [Lachnellula subtilissima]